MNGGWIRMMALVLALALGPALPALADPVPAAPASGGSVVVAVAVAPPFVMKDASGQWTGLAIDLWRAVAGDLGLRSSFVEASVEDIISGVAKGRYAAGVGAITITEPREVVIDFSQPFFTTGWGIVTRPRGNVSWVEIAGHLLTGDFLKLVGALAGVLLAAGVLVWLFEHRRNHEQFGRGTLHGIGAGFWWAAVTMTSVGYGDKTPKTVGGRVIAIVWMFAATILLASFTASIASLVTVQRLNTLVDGPEDLVRVRTGAVQGSAGGEMLAAMGVNAVPFPDVATGIQAVADGRIEAFVDDMPLLHYAMSRRSQDGSVVVLPHELGREDYGLVFPYGSDLRELANRKLLQIIRSPAWKDMIRQYLGSQPDQ